MGKRQERLYGQLLLDKKDSLLHQSVQVVLWSGKTTLGDIQAVNAESIEIVSKGAVWYNKKRYTQCIAFADIFEIITERVTEW